MKDIQYGLTGEGFSKEEADELLDGYQRPPMTKEEREQYLAFLERFAARVRAEKAEAASNGETNGTRVTREDLEREMKRQRVCQDQGATE